MGKRTLTASFDDNPYIEGYLHEQALAGGDLDYGYRVNRLPKTTGNEQEIKSSFELVSQQESSA